MTQLHHHVTIHYITMADVFKMDDDYIINEEKYKEMSGAILGEVSDSDSDGSGSDESSSEDSG